MARSDSKEGGWARTGRRHVAVLAAALITVAAALGPVFAPPARAAEAPITASDGTACAAGEVLLTVSAGTPNEAIVDALAARGAKVQGIETIYAGNAGYDATLLVRYAGGPDPAALSKQLTATAPIRHAEPNESLEPAPDEQVGEVGGAGAPTRSGGEGGDAYVDVNDPYWEGQWEQNPTNFCMAWQTVCANGNVTVAVLDSGADVDHPDLRPNLVLGDYAKDVHTGRTGAAAVDDESWHGTLISGIISAVANNGIYYAGASYNAKILPIKTVYSSAGAGRSWRSDVIKAVDYVVSLKTMANAPSYLKNIRVINLSLGGAEYSESWQQAVNRATAAGILVCASAGNSKSSELRYPGSLDHVVSVSALRFDPDSSAHDFAHRVVFDDSYSSYGPRVDLSAPGTKIYSTIPLNYYADGSGWGSGTSFSTPLVASAAALLFAERPSLTPGQVQALLTTTATDLGAPGRDDYYGFGGLNAQAAVERASSPIARIGTLAGNLSVTGTARAGSELRAAPNLPAAQNNAWLQYQWIDAATGKAVTAKGFSGALWVSDALAGKTVCCVATDSSGLYGGSVRSASFKVPAASGVTFADVTPGNEADHASDVLWLAKNGISTGWNVNGVHWFRGMQDVTRADMAAFLYRLAGSPAFGRDSTLEGKFTDVNDSTPHATAIRWLIAERISGGWAAGGGKKEFRPYASVTRQDMAAFLHRFARVLKGDVGADTQRLTFADFNPGSETDHASDVHWLASWGISKGFNVRGTYRFEGLRPVARQDMAAFLHRLYGNVLAK